VDREGVAVSVDAFRRILRELRLQARRTEASMGLSAAQSFVLSAIVASPDCSVNEVADATMTDRSSAAAIVQRLVELGYASRERSSEDRRRAAIAITAKGRRALRKAPPAPTVLLVQALHRLPAAERARLAAGLLALTHEMGIAHEPAGMLFDDTHVATRRRR
jgi:DNA-binding MarR family transcriptional regulator